MKTKRKKKMKVELVSKTINEDTTYYKWLVEYNNKKDNILFSSDWCVFEPFIGNFDDNEMINIKLYIIDNNIF